MSTTTATRPPTPAQRTTEILQQLVETLDCQDPKKLNLAILEVAAELAKSEDFSHRVLQYYRSLEQPSTNRANAKAANTKDSNSAQQKTDNNRRIYAKPLIPIRKVDNHYIDPNALPDPHFLLQLYGAEQIEQALDEYDLPVLKKTVAQVKKLHPKTKPKTATQRYDLIDYLVSFVKD